MSQKDKHSRGELLDQFCTVPVSKGKCSCPSPNDYRKNAACPWGDPFQGHHLVPITCVQSQIMSKSELRGTVAQTRWCINNVPNMYAMPIWGHTVRHYCRKNFAFFRKPPPFANIPQHLNDHDLYNQEVSGKLKVVVDQWKPHEATTSNISGLLDTTSRTMQAKLVNRGSARTGGTHNAWSRAVSESEQGREFSKWYLPFSMADTLDVRKRAFPYKGDANTINTYIEKITAALKL